jgi:hypothetical protein
VDKKRAPSLVTGEGALEDDLTEVGRTRLASETGSTDRVQIHARSSGHASGLRTGLGGPLLTTLPGDRHTGDDRGDGYQTDAKGTNRLLRRLRIGKASDS